MPYIVSQQHDQSEAAAASIAFDLLVTPAVGDVIAICATNDVGSTTITCPGFSGPAQAANQGIRQAWLTKVSDGTESTLTLTGTNAHWIFSCYILRGVNTSGTPYVASARQDWATVAYQDSIAFDATSAGNNSLLFYSWAHDTSTTVQYQWVSPSDMEVDYSIYGTSINHIVGHRTLFVAGNAPTVRMYTGQNTDGGNGWVIAFPDATGTTPQWSFTSMLDIIRMGGNMGRLTEVDYPGATTFTATGSAATNIFTATGWTPVDGAQVVVRSVTGGGTNIVSLNTVYHVFGVSDQTFQITSSLAAAGAYGAALDITADVTASTMIVQVDKVARPTAIAASINGISTGDTSSAYTTVSTVLGSSYATGDNFTSTLNTTNAWAGQTIIFGTAKDMSGNRIFSMDWATDTGWNTSRVRSGGAIIVFGDGTNWTAYQLSTKSASSNSLRSTSFIALGQGVTYATSGSINWAAVDRIGIFYQRGGSSAVATALVIRCMVLFNTAPVVIGGCSQSPANGFELKKAFGTLGFDHLGSASGLAQSIDRIPYKIGDGSNLVYWDSSVGSQENPDAFLASSSSRSRWNVDSGYATIRVHLSSSSNFIANSCVFAGRNAQQIVIDAASSASGNYSLSNATISGKTLINDGNIDLGSFTVSECPQVDGGTATYDTVVFLGCTASGSSALKLEGGGGAINCSFTKGAETYAVEISGNGPIAIDLSGTTFSGYTNVLNLTGTTGVVTITLALGQVEPTYITAGATVVWDQPQADTTWTNADLANGTTILVVNRDTATTIDYVTVSGGTGYTITLTPGVDYEVGEVIEIRQSRQSGTSYYIQRTSIINTSAEGGSILEVDELEACALCNGIGLSGIDYITKFELDYANGELDIKILGSWQVGELISWWNYMMTQQAAMEDFWGAWELQSDGSFRNEVSVLSSVLDTTAFADSIETTGRRLYRSDGARPIKTPTTSGYAIDCSWRDPVTTVSVGSGLSAGEQATLAKLDTLTENSSGLRFTAKALETTVAAPSASTVAAAVRSEIATELGRMDAAVTTRSTLDSTAAQAAAAAAIAAAALASQASVNAIPTNPLLTNDARLDAIATRASQTSVNAIPTNPLLANDSRLDDIATRASQTSVNAIPTNPLLTNDARLDAVAAIQAKTDALPAVPASEATAQAAVDAARLAAALSA